ncbi:M56 family metallopeptidase [Schlesneria paludicola]|uniref:M56 family metallopeptidase n=1 Tax=Schlesneria paludicola TaxID=360056 RepID=UPI00029A8591|nr:M56 family metallopeptidase [Schlesneria paludicola]
MMVSYLLTALLSLGTGIAAFLVNWWLQSTLLIAAGLIGGALLKHRGAALQSVIYRSTLAAALMCPFATGLLALSGASGWSIHLPASQVVRTAIEPPQSPNERSSTVSQDVSSSVSSSETPLHVTERTLLALSTSPSPSIGSEDTSHAAADSPLPATTLISPNPTQTTSGTSTIESITPMGWIAIVGSAVWTILASLFSFRLASAWARVEQLRRNSMTADNDIRELCQELASSIGVPSPDVRHSPFVSSPFLAGLQRPVVMLPEVDADLRIREVLIHELAHLRRRDCDWNLLLQIATAFFFFQPLIWMLGRRIESTAEDVCDDYVVRFGGDRIEYASQLTVIAERTLAPVLTIGVGMMSFRSMLARRVSRIMDGSRTLSTRAGHLIVLAVIVVGFLATMTAGFIGLAARPIQAESESSNSAATTAPSKAEVTAVSANEVKQDGPVAIDHSSQIFQGTVVDPSGKPVAGAKIYLVAYFREPIRPFEANWRPVCMTNAKGEFRFGKDELSAYGELSPNRWNHATLCATADGYGFGWSTVALFETSGSAVNELRKLAANLPDPYREAQLKVLESAGQPLQLKPDDQPIEGQILNIDGQPVVGAKVLLIQARTGADERLEEWQKKTTEERADFYSTNQALSKQMNGPQVRSLITPGLTDAQGKFVLRGIGRDRIVQLLIEGPGIQSDLIYARTQPGKPIEMPNEWARGDMRKELYHPSQLIHVAGPSQPIVGTIVDKISKQPIPGAVVLSQKRHGHPINGWGQDFVRTVADSEGRFRLEGMPIGADNRIGVISPSDRAYLSTSKQTKTTASADPLKVDFELQPGVWITGRVTDKQSGEGLAGHFEPFTFRDNKAGERGQVDERQSLRADNQGRFRLVVAPGPGIIAFQAEQHQKYPRGAGADTIKTGKKASSEVPYFETRPSYCMPSSFHFVKEIDPSLDQHEIQLDLTLDAGNNLKGHVVDESGKPLSTAAYSGKIKEFAAAWDQVDPDGQFEILGYDAAVPRTVAFFDREKSLAAQILITGPVTSPLVVKLAPAGNATGRIVDEHNDPIPNLQLLSWTPRRDDSNGEMRQSLQAPPLPPGDFRRHRSNLFNDSQGRFELKHLIPGQEYRIRVLSREGKDLSKQIYAPLDVVIKVKAGEVLDLGDIRIADEKTFTEKFKEQMRSAPGTKGG